MLSLERNWHIAKSTLNCKGTDLHSEEKSTDMYNSIDRVVEKLERELKKQREKETNHRAHRGSSGESEPTASEGKAKSSAAPKADDPYSAKVEKAKRFTPASLTVDEAVKELESQA